MTKFNYILTTAIVTSFAAVCAYGGFRLAFKGMIFPNIYVAGINVSGLSKENATALVSTRFEKDPNSVVLQINGAQVTKLNELQVKIDASWAVEQAYGIGRSGNILTEMLDQTNLIRNRRDVEMPIVYDKENLTDIINQISEEYSHKPKWPTLVNKSGKILLEKGEDGLELDKGALEKEILRSLVLPGKQTIHVQMKTVATNENSKSVGQAILALEKWRENKLTLKFRDYEKALGVDELLGLFGLWNDPINNDGFAKLVETIRPQTETEAKDAVLVFENDKVNDFKPEIIGAVIDVPLFKEEITEKLLAGESATLEIPMILSYPKIKAGDINNLGIKELIGSGKSSFSHSIPGRVFNVNLAASRIKGTVVAPGEEFSFNENVGEISKSTGYQSAYIISGGKTVLGDGGGVCQVSTTVFRAALSAGLPITERRAHAYRVGYYEQDSSPGIDATIFSPTADLKFLNDTGHHILVQTSVDLKKLTMSVDIYGTSDGRIASISKPVISSQTPPPPTIYVDDPTLPLGAVKQVDWSAWGAKVSFDYKVMRDNATIYEKTFFSNYQPWQAIYMKGTGDLAMR